MEELTEEETTVIKTKKDMGMDTQMYMEILKKYTKVNNNKHKKITKYILIVKKVRRNGMLRKVRIVREVMRKGKGKGILRKPKVLGIFKGMRIWRSWNARLGMIGGRKVRGRWLGMIKKLRKVILMNISKPRLTKENNAKFMEFKLIIPY